MPLSQIDFLRHILDECVYLQKESESNTLDDFIANQRLIKAICRSLEIIGEASNKVHPDLKAKYSVVPWREMGDIRNKIIHNYFGIDYEIIWDAVTTEIPVLKNWMEVIIEQEQV